MHIGIDLGGTKTESIIIDQDGKEISRGLSNYDSVKARLIIGKSSEEIEKILDCKDEDELIHRDNMILI